MPRTEIKVPGRKKVARMVMAFIAELSRLLALAISRESWAMFILERLSCWVIRLKS